MLLVGEGYNQKDIGRMWDITRSFTMTKPGSESFRYTTIIIILIIMIITTDSYSVVLTLTSVTRSVNYIYIIFSW